MKSGSFGEDACQLVGVHRRDRGRVELAPQTAFQLRGGCERPLERDLLVENHADEKGERVLRKQRICFSVSRQVKGHSEKR